MVAAVWKETKGNPLFMREAVRLLSTEGRLGDLGDPGAIALAVPAGVRDVIARRIAHLSEPAARLLRTAALIGPEFAVTLLARVDESSPEAVLDLLDEAVEAGLLIPVLGGSGRYRFAHDLVREGLYTELGSGQRARMHRRVADALEEMQATGSGTYLAELAFHFHQALQSGLLTDDDQEPRVATRAIEYALLAGDRARSSLAYEEATRLYEMAIDVLRQGVDEPQRELEILLSIGDAVARAGDPARSMSHYLEAASIARRTGAVSEFARAALGFSGRLPWLRPGKDTSLIPLLQEALALLGGSNDPLRVRLLARLACAWRSSPGQLEQAAALAREAVTLARELDDAPTLSYALAGQYWATWGPGHIEDRERLAREMIQVAQATGDGERLLDAHVMLELVHAEIGRMAEVRQEIEDVARAVRELRQPAQLWLGTSIRALVALMQGEFEFAESLVAEELQVSPPATYNRDELSTGRMHLFLLRREQGRVAESEPFVRAAVEDFPWYPLHRAALVLLLIETSRLDEARAVFAALAQDDFKALYRDNEWLLGMSLASEGCYRLGERAAAEIAYRQLAPFAGLHAIGANEGSAGAVDRYLGLLAATLGDDAAAVAHLSEALRLNGQWGALPWAAHVQADLAAVLRRRGAVGDEEQASGLEHAALDTALRLGMLGLTRQLEPLVSRLPRRAEAPDVGNGTFRGEGEYWTLVFGDEHVEIRDSRGMSYLARLLANPGRELHALDLAQRGGDARSTHADRIPADLRVGGVEDAAALVDQEARNAYRTRLDELRAELQQADDWNDSERAARSRSEVEFLEDELGRALGLGGRERKVASAAERARISVTRALRSAINRVASRAPALGEHLSATIRTGTYCSYAPDPRVPIHWEL